MIKKKMIASLSIGLSLVVALAVLVTFLPQNVTPAQANPDTLEWSEVNTPSWDDLVIAPNTDIQDFAVGPDGDTIYAMGVEYGYDSAECDVVPSPTLWKSTDGGYTWEDITEAVIDAENLPPGYNFTSFSAIAVAPDDEDFVALAGTDDDWTEPTEETRVVISDDGGDTFYDTHDLADDSAIPPTYVGLVSCMAISPEVDDTRNIAVGGTGPYGGIIYRLEIELDGLFAPYWTDTTGAIMSEFTVSGDTTGILHATWDSFTDEWSGEDLVVEVDVNFSNDGSGDQEWQITYTQVDGTNSTVNVTIPQNATNGWSSGPLDVTAIDVTGVTIITEDISAGEWRIRNETSTITDHGTYTIGGAPFVDGFTGEDLDVNVITAPPLPLPEDFSVSYTDTGGAQTDTLSILPGGGFAWTGSSNVLDITNITAQTQGKYPGWFDCLWVTSIAFSPNFADDGTILAMCFRLLDAFYLQTGEWTSGYGWWNEEGAFPPAIEIKDGTKKIEPTILLPVIQGMTGIALPSDYFGYDPDSRVVYVYVNGCHELLADCGGYLFRIDNDELSDGCGPKGACYLASIDYHGTIDSGKLLAGLWSTECQVCEPEPPACCEGLQVYRATDLDCCCPEWFSSCKPPSGQAQAKVAFTPDGNKAYAATQGTGLADESAFSVSIDDGFSWNQIGLIDTDTDFISDIAVCPDCETVYMSTINNDECFLYSDPECPEDTIICQACECDSVWRSKSNVNGGIGSQWERVYHGDFSDTPVGDTAFLTDPSMQDPILLRLPCDETEDCCTIYLGDYDSDNLYYSIDCGQCWSQAPGTKIPIQDVAVETENVIYILDADGNVSKSNDYGRRWSDEVDTEIGSGHTIASCCIDDMVVVGGAEGGEVAFSEDGGESWTLTDELPDDAMGEVHVICDHTCPGTIYAAVSGVGIYRTTIDSGAWDDLNAEPYDYFGIVLGRSDGTLYAPYAYENLNCESGVARNLDPCETACCGEEDWDYLTAGLTDDECFNTEPSALRICGCLTLESNSLLWAIDFEHYAVADGSDGTVWVYEDCLAKHAPDLISPPCGADIEAEPCAGCTNPDINLCWERLCIACTYDIEVASDEDFNQVVITEEDYAPGDAEDPCFLIPHGTLQAGTTYYWHVRVAVSESDESAKSQWSKTCSFNIGAGPGAGVHLLAPQNSETDVAISNVGFSWSTVGGATNYSFVLSADSDLYGALASTETSSTAYIYTGTLDYATSYFWQVTAWKDSSVLSVSDIGTFTTATEPVTPTEAPAPPPAEKVVIPAAQRITPNWIYAMIAVGATVAALAIVLIVRTRRP